MQNDDFCMNEWDSKLVKIQIRSEADGNEASSSLLLLLRCQSEMIASLLDSGASYI